MKTLKDLILDEHSKAQAFMIADIVAQKPELLHELLEYSLANKEPLSRRASWPLRILHAQHPELFAKHFDGLINQLDFISSTPVLRNILSLLVHAELPENKKSYLLSFATKTILNPKSPIAVIAHASDLFIRIADGEQALLKELVLMLDQIGMKESGGIRAKIRQVNILIE